jgi:hypothetical protein
MSFAIAKSWWFSAGRCVGGNVGLGSAGGIEPVGRIVRTHGIDRVARAVVRAPRRAHVVTDIEGDRVNVVADELRDQGAFTPARVFTALQEPGR